MSKGRFDKSQQPVGPSQRMLRVGELIRHALADILQRGDVFDPVIAGHIITVPQVRMSPDLKLATCYVMPLGGKDEKAVVEALERNKKFLRGEVGHRMREMRSIPELRFRLDDSFDEALRIDALLNSPKVKRDLEPHGDDE